MNPLFIKFDFTWKSFYSNSADDLSDDDDDDGNDNNDNDDDNDHDRIIKKSTIFRNKDRGRKKFW